jgi:hypothetical protein
MPDDQNPETPVNPTLSGPAVAALRKIYDQDRCINTSCEAGRGSIYDRGLCWPCFRNAQLRVRSGLGTWEGLESEGLACPQLPQRELPVRPQDRPDHTPVV